MKLIKIIFESLLMGSSAFNDAVRSIKDLGGKFIGSGDYGKVFQVGDKVMKVTTDEVELEHAQILKGKTTRNFVKIIEVEPIHFMSDTFGIITMENLDPLDPSDEVDEQLIADLEAEAQSLGIDPEELDIYRGSGNDIHRDNFMKDPITGKIKMVDV